MVRSDVKEDFKKAIEEGLKDEELNKVSGGFNPQPDPPRGGLRIQSLR